MKKYDHTWLIAEWERMGRPQCQMYDGFDGSWDDVYGDPAFSPEFVYCIKSKPSICSIAKHADDKRNKGTGRL